MYSIVTGKEKYIRDMPVVGMNPQFYTIPNLNTMMPRVDYQFYNPWTGAMGPNISTNSYGNLNNNLNTTLNTTLNNISNNVSVTTEIYDRKGLYAAIVGTPEDVRKIINCVDMHFGKPEKTVETKKDPLERLLESYKEVDFDHDREILRIVRIFKFNVLFLNEITDSLKEVKQKELVRKLSEGIMKVISRIRESIEPYFEKTNVEKLKNVLGKNAIIVQEFRDAAADPNPDVLTKKIATAIIHTLTL